MGRVVQKKGEKDLNGKVVEVLGMRSGIEGGISFAEGTVDKDKFQDGIKSLVKSVVEKFGDERRTFWVFSHELNVEDGQVRKVIEEADPGSVAYGGKAVGGSVIGKDSSGSGDAGRIQVAAVSGAVNFLQSAVVKSWTQPAYVEPLTFMTPKYVDDPETDLLTAIRYDDWDKFMECIEDKKVSINHKWVKKQSQIPLLAACARGRLKMVQYLLDHGADHAYRNDGGFTAAMYTMKLIDYGQELVDKQLEILKKAGANVELSAEDQRRLDASSSKR